MSLYDRDYMRPVKTGPGETIRRTFARATAVHWAVGGLALAGVLQYAATLDGHEGFIRENLCLTLDGLRSGKVPKLWEFLTYALIHGGFFHLFFNALGLWFLGRGVAEEHGAKKFWQVLGAGVVAGGLAWAVIWSLPLIGGHAPAQEALAGISAGVFALMAYYMADKLREEFRLLVFLVIPVTLEGAWILGVTAALSVGGLFLTEIPMATGWWRTLIPDTMCHSAHLAGLTLGFAWRVIELRIPHWRADRRRPKFSVISKDAVATAPRDRKFAFPAARPAGRDLRGEVDRILDKINASGFGALTPEERSTLEKARETLRR